MTEHQAYLRQARSDFAVFELLRERDRRDVPECHPLHYLQMATEKLAKAAFRASGVTMDKFSHVAFSHIPYQLARRHVAAALGFRSFDSYREFLRRTAPLFRAIDELNPAVGASGAAGAKEGPNVEYPWPGRAADGGETWIVPAETRFRLIDKLRAGEGAQVQEFVRILLDRFEIIFA